MISKEDYEYLKNLPYLGIKPAGILSLIKTWYASGDTIGTVAYILNTYGIFGSTSRVIDYFEKPYKWEIDILRLINEYEEEKAREIREGKQEVKYNA